MRSENFSVTRASDDGLCVQVWGFRARGPDHYGRWGSKDAFTVTLISYEAGQRETPRHKKLKPSKRLHFGQSHRFDGIVRGWFDCTGDEYSWRSADLRGAKPTTERPPLPEEVVAEAAARLKPIVKIAEVDA